MASSRRGQPALSVPVASAAAAAADVPPITALFLIDFDVKAGYTIVWKRADPGLELDGTVEYKSLPSGLHTVTDDLIYFVHERSHAGLSAFVNEPCDEEDARNARMIAVGILVPLSYGRLGRAWRHAEGLKELASKLAKDRKDTALLEQYWESHKAPQGDDSSRPHTGETPLPSPSVSFANIAPPLRKGHTRNRSASDGAALAPGPGPKLSPHHPAWSLSSLLDKFGPLIFPIHRAALLRRRILISCHAPVHQVCDFVYNISILSNIPLSVLDILPTSAPTQRLRPLFTIGVHDISTLMEDLEASKRQAESATDDELSAGWIACTTDSILAMKDTLWDMLITMPPEHSANAKEKVWPVVECPRGRPVKATQRDLRRFNALRSGLTRMLTASAPANTASPEGDLAGAKPLAHSDHVVKNGAEDTVDRLVEPSTWSALAYNGFMWWASAGEQPRSELQEESARDAALLADLEPFPQSPMSVPRTPSREALASAPLASLADQRGPGGDEARVELAIVAYFHRLTTQMLSTLSDVVDTVEEPYTDEDDEDTEESGDAGRNALLRQMTQDGGEAAVTVHSRAVEQMGLDVWSANDVLFVQELMSTYFGRPARVEGKGVEVCGVRVC
jgi:hypothetical protein